MLMNEESNYQAGVIILTFVWLFSGLLHCCFGHIAHYAHLRNALNIEKYPAQILWK